jgi:DNA primase
MKYKKLLVHKEGCEYVSSCVWNSYFYGEDSLKGADYCIITEGVADCIVMLKAGFSCISPVTVQFRDKDHQKLVSLTKGLKRVYICNDNESNEVGLKGALRTAEALENENIEARFIILPKTDGIDKIDIADYMKKHSPEDFKGLMGSSVRVWQYRFK